MHPEYNIGLNQGSTDMGQEISNRYGVEFHVTSKNYGSEVDLNLLNAYGQIRLCIGFRPKASSNSRHPSPELFFLNSWDPRHKWHAQYDFRLRDILEEGPGNYKLTVRSGSRPGAWRVTIRDPSGMNSLCNWYGPHEAEELAPRFVSYSRGGSDPLLGYKVTAQLVTVSPLS